MYLSHTLKVWHLFHFALCLEIASFYFIILQNSYMVPSAGLFRSLEKLCYGFISGRSLLSVFSQLFLLVFFLLNLNYWKTLTVFLLECYIITLTWEGLTLWGCLFLSKHLPCLFTEVGEFCFCFCFLRMRDTRACCLPVGWFSGKASDRDDAQKLIALLGSCPGLGQRGWAPRLWSGACSHHGFRREDRAERERGEECQCGGSSPDRLCPLCNRKQGHQLRVRNREKELDAWGEREKQKEKELTAMQTVSGKEQCRRNKFS